MDTEKLIKDFDLPEDTQVLFSPFIFFNGAQHKEMQEGRAKLEKLMKMLGITPFYIKEENEIYKVIKG